MPGEFDKVQQIVKSRARVQGQLWLYVSAIGATLLIIYFVGR